MGTTYYLNYNDQIIDQKEQIFTSQNRSYRYGDGLFETIRLIDGELHLFEQHIERLFNGVEFLKIKAPKNWNPDFFKQRIMNLFEKNKITKNGRARLSIFRTDGGLYSPRSSKGDFVIECEEYANEGFPLNKKGLKIDIFTDMEKSTNVYSNFKTNNSLVYVLASIYKKDNDLDDCLIINSKNRVAEAISSNLFIVKNDQVITPPLSEGCVAGVMRTEILDIMNEHKIPHQENPVVLEDLFKADEIFMTDSIKGVRWVNAYKVKRFEFGIAEKLSQLLNKRVSA